MVTTAMSAILAYSGPGRRRPGSIPGDTWSSRAGACAGGRRCQPLSNVLLLTSGRDQLADDAQRERLRLGGEVRRQVRRGGDDLVADAVLLHGLDDRVRHGLPVWG